jgi:hypothetical protein
MTDGRIVESDICTRFPLAIVGRPMTILVKNLDLFSSDRLSAFVRARATFTELGVKHAAAERPFAQHQISCRVLKNRILKGGARYDRSSVKGINYKTTVFEKSIHNFADVESKLSKLPWATKNYYYLDENTDKQRITSLHLEIKQAFGLRKKFGSGGILDIAVR